MNLIALLVIWFSLLIKPVATQTQGFRGEPGATRSAGAPAQITAPATQPRQGFANSQVGNPVAPRTSSTAPRAQFHNVPHGTLVHPVAPPMAPKIIPNPNHRSLAIAAPHPVQPRGAKFAVVHVAPHDHHRPRFYHRHPAVAIVEWPYVYSPIVITQIAPGVISAAPRYAEEPPSEARSRDPGQVAPFDPTPEEVVERMLRLANVKSGDLLYDLGAGDGRIVIAAAKQHGIRAVGFEIDPGLAKLARENARKQGVERLVEIREQDFLTADLSPASVVTLYLSYDGNLALRPRLMTELKPGARIVSYTFDMGEWQPKISETYRDAGGDAHAIYFWQIGEPLAFR